MPSNPSQDQTATQRLAVLETQLDQTLAATRRKGVIVRILTVLSVGLLGFYFYHAHQQISRFDTETAADLLQARIQEALPQASRGLSDSLAANAPQVIADAQTLLLTMPHELLSVQLKGFLLHHLAEQIGLVEEQFYLTVKTQIEGIKAQYLGDGSQTLDEAATAELLDQVITVYGREASAVLEKVYNHYAQEADIVVRYLHRLTVKKNLSYRDKIRRDLLQAILLTIKKYQGDGDSQWEPMFRRPLEALVPVN